MIVKFSMNGFRRELSKDISTLRDLVVDVAEGNYYEDEYLIVAMNKIIQHSNAVNCVYSDEDPDFDDISSVEVSEIEGVEL